MRDSHNGTYVIGQDDAWVKEQERQRADVASVEEDRGELYRDPDGNDWEGFQNKYQQRQLRCIAGPRAGQIIHDPRLSPAPEQRRAHIGGFDDSGTFFG